ncbi:fimbria/pilus periplasmic chaperone [Pantoea sp. Lu_F5_004]|uniref:fimbria/pilus periplasmic chaperone n=1 Tax=Pantoea sp. Lu_F5_004 TaxID=3443507 RepID=UPI003EBE077B
MFLVRKVLIALLYLASTQPSISCAGGIGPGATRVIYPESHSHALLAMNNSDEAQEYLIKGWVSDENGNYAHGFTVTPSSLFVPPKNKKMLRIIYRGKPLPSDHEIMYIMNIMATPAINKNLKQGDGIRPLSILFRMKVFMRPSGLKMNEKASAKDIRFIFNGKKMTVFNPTPYYQSIVNLQVGNNKIANSTVPPLGTFSFRLPVVAVGAFHYQTVDDYGALSEQQTGKIQ